MRDGRVKLGHVFEGWEVCPAAIGAIPWNYEVTFERAAVLLGLSAIAVAQPISKSCRTVASSSPRGARLPRQRSRQFWPFASDCLWRCSASSAHRSQRFAAAIFFGLALAVLVAALAMPLLRPVETLTYPWDALIGGLVGIGVAVLHVEAASFASS